MAGGDERRVLVDTSILFYSIDHDAGARHERSLEVLDAVWSARTGVVSTQILSEWAVNLRRRCRPQPRPESRGDLRPMDLLD